MSDWDSQVQSICPDSGQVVLNVTLDLIPDWNPDLNKVHVHLQFSTVHPGVGQIRVERIQDLNILVPALGAEDLLLVQGELEYLIRAASESNGLQFLLRVCCEISSRVQYIRPSLFLMSLFLLILLAGVKPPIWVGEFLHA